MECNADSLNRNFRRALQPSERPSKIALKQGYSCLQRIESTHYYQQKRRARLEGPRREAPQREQIVHAVQCAKIRKYTVERSHWGFKRFDIRNPCVDAFANAGGSRLGLQPGNHGGGYIDRGDGDTALREVDRIIAGPTPQIQ